MRARQDEIYQAGLGLSLKQLFYPTLAELLCLSVILRRRGERQQAEQCGGDESHRRTKGYDGLGWVFTPRPLFLSPAGAPIAIYPDGIASGERT